MVTRKRGKGIDNRMISIALVAAGAVLLFWGYESSQSLESSLTKTFTGTYKDKTMWLLLGGAVCLALGIYRFSKK